MKKIFLFIVVFLTTTLSYAEVLQDTITTYMLDEIVITSSSKETNSIKTLPTALSIISPKSISYNQITSLKDLSSLVPNLYIPNYGSRMTSAVYIRGIGARSSGQSIGMYVDNVPYMDKSIFDFDWMDIQRIEILRGPQGTLYGRNAMSGIVNIYTQSPFNYQGSKVSIGGGNHGLLKSSLSHYSKLNDKLAISIGGYYNRHDGFYTNKYDNKKIDQEENAGGQAKLEWLISDLWELSYSTNFNYTDQGAFPYGLYNIATKDIEAVNYNDEGSYKRKTFTNSLSLSYIGKSISFGSTTAYQYNNDNMWMDQDYSPKSIFTLNQKQKQHSFNEEVYIKSNHFNNYQWNFGAFGFYNSFNTAAPVTFKEDGIKTILQPVFDQIKINNPRAPQITVKDNASTIPGDFDTPTYGLALFHQSTYNNLLVDGLSVTAGIRLDYEKASLDYNTQAAMNLEVRPSGTFVIPMMATDTMIGSLNKDFLQILPKVAIKYELSPNSFIYTSVAKGYKTGGYNIQMFSDIVQQNMMNKYSGGGDLEASLKETVSFDPEYSWNYEIGTRSEIIKNKLNIEASLFLINVRNLQLTKFVPSGNGRMIANAGEATSKGIEISINGELIPNLSYFANYGFTHSTFDNYKTNIKTDDGTVQEVDYKGNHIPFAPQNTLTVGLNYRCEINKPLLDRIIFNTQYIGTGKIYWTERNDVSQNYYSTLNAKVSLIKDAFELSFWGKNLTDTNYNTFYFESRGNGYAQYAKPLQIGADLTFKF